MAFENLSRKLTASFKHVMGKDVLTEKNVEAMLSEIRIALLEADVNYGVVRNFISQLKEKIIGLKVESNLEPGQQVYKIVYDQLVSLLGSQSDGLNYRSSGLTVIMVVGLQGTGKTTSAAKMAKLIKEKQNRRPLLIAADIIRPAAIEQLQTLGRQIDVEVFSMGTEVSAVETVAQGIKRAGASGYDTVIIDTAGRLQIDQELMDELSEIKDKFKPDEILLTVDAMTGQDIVNVAKTFNDRLNITGLIVTKFDGDARGGGVLSVRAVTDVAVKMVGVGEKIDDIDIFYPDRMASRILGMGDMQTLVEKAEEQLDEKQAMETAQKMADGKYDLNDMLIQIQQMKKLGPLSGILKMIPGLSQYSDQLGGPEQETAMKKNTAIIQSMTMAERRDPSALRSSHKNRIAAGSGTTVTDVNRLINNFERSKKMMGQMGLASRMKQLNK